MAQSCAATGAEMALIEGLASSADCHIGALVQTGYGAIFGANSPLIPFLTALLTIYVAVMGLRLMLGLGALRVGDLTLSVVKIGIVVALATNWPLYQQLVFETLFNGPEQLASGMLKGALPSANSLYDGLQYAFDEMQAGAQFFAAQTPGGASPWLGGSGFSAAALTFSSVLMLASTVGVLLGLKIVLAIVLLTGPLFLGFFLFQSTRGIFAGWLRAAIGLSLAPLFALLAAVLQLQMIQAHLGALAALRAQVAEPLAFAAPPVAILLVTMITSLVALAGLGACALIGMSLRLPLDRSRAAPHGHLALQPQAHEVRSVQAGSNRPLEAPPRIASVAAAAAAMERRDSRMFLQHASRTGGTQMAPRTMEPSPGVVAGGASSFNPRRAARPPVAASSLRRDR